MLKHERKTQNEERGGDTIEPFLAALLSEENNSKISILILFFFPLYKMQPPVSQRGPGAAVGLRGNGLPRTARAGGSAKGELGPQRHPRPPQLQRPPLQGLTGLRGTEGGLPLWLSQRGHPRVREDRKSVV